MKGREGSAGSQGFQGSLLSCRAPGCVDACSPTSLRFHLYCVIPLRPTPSEWEKEAPPPPPVSNLDSSSRSPSPGRRKSEPRGLGVLRELGLCVGRGRGRAGLLAGPQEATPRLAAGWGWQPGLGRRPQRGDDALRRLAGWGRVLSFPGASRAYPEGSGRGFAASTPPLSPVASSPPPGR